MKVRILPAARTDLELAADFYESQYAGLGAEFLESLVADIDKLEVHGGVHRIEFGFHKSISKRFPFAIYYLVESETADIYAVVDCRQDPEATFERLG